MSSFNAAVGFCLITPKGMFQAFNVSNDACIRTAFIMTLFLALLLLLSSSLSAHHFNTLFFIHFAISVPALAQLAMLYLSLRLNIVCLWFAKLLREMDQSPKSLVCPGAGRHCVNVHEAWTDEWILKNRQSMPKVSSRDPCYRVEGECIPIDLHSWFLSTTFPSLCFALSMHDDFSMNDVNGNFKWSILITPSYICQEPKC